MAKTRFWLTIILPYGLGYFITTAYRSINAILAHPLSESLHLNAIEICWITSTFVLTFALAQIPLGILLDYWGPRKTQALFFFMGGVGIVIFGLGSSVTMLSLGRAVLGVGMAGGLMAAFKSISEWVEKEEIPYFNGIILATGGIGALVATTPSKLFEMEFGWRTLCIAMGIMTFLIALLIFLVSRDKPSSQEKHTSLSDQFSGLKKIYATPYFWDISPLFIFTLGGFIAMQGLWLGPWLQHVVGFNPLESAHYLSAIAIAMTFGMISGGLFSYLSKLLRISLLNIVVIGIIIHILTQMVIVLNLFSHHYLTWFVYGYFAQVTLVNYALIAQFFGAQLSGRAITAVNIFIFLFAFLVQYLFGIIIHVGAGDQILAYKVAFSGLIILECLALVWLWYRRRSNVEQTSVMKSE